MFYKITLFVALIFLVYFNQIPNLSAANTNGGGEITGYTTLTTVDLGTFNEYRYRLTEQFFKLRDKFNIDRVLDVNVLKKIDSISKEGYNYLPDNLKNKNIISVLNTEIKKGIKYPNNESNYGSIVNALQAYIENVTVEKINGNIEAFPKTGNAPLNVTLRGVIRDPTGTRIPDNNYTWWIDDGGKRKILGHRVSLNYTFVNEGDFSVFLDVKSSHKNVRGYTDVISFRSRTNIAIKAKIASVIININSNRLNSVDNIKFSPEEAKYGLLFDATSSTPTSGSKFIETSWDFGNGIKKTYSGNPKIERIVYSREGDFKVKLRLKTNELKVVERVFTISIHNPIATIYSSKSNGFLGDKFTFSAKTNSTKNNLTYSWEIVNIDNDQVILTNTSDILTYMFNKKGRYSIKLKATNLGGNIDIDTKIISINSRPPVAKFSTKISASNTPNKIFFDATKSFDPDFTDEGKLEYSWIIDGNRILLDNSNSKGSTGYYTFDSIGDHSVVLEVTDPDKITSQEKKKVNINSILSVDFEALPRVITRNGKIDFVSISPEALFYEWNFGDNQNTGGKYDKISHLYNKSGMFSVKLTVRDKNDNTNSIKKVVYVGESDNPYAFISLKSSGKQNFVFQENACGDKGAYIVDKVTTLKLSGEESINITGKKKGLTYSWKLGKNKYFSSSSISYRFDEIGCFPVKLTVKSKDNNRTNSITKWMKVENVLPTLSSIEVNVKDITTDPVVVNLKALGAKDKDGIIQSYLWYYYTDVDSEPQDFRSTIGPSTNFVLPKVTGNYYFVVVMKDNNEALISSEEISKSKYFITLTGDNINTPLINFNVNDSSFSVGDDVVFSTTVKNILGHNISKDAKYSWDFDGDGFYDKQTSKPSVTYKYNYSGKYHVKLKVIYKGFSNTKSLTVNVANKLIPKFEYISIGNKYLFFNLSKGKIDTTTWDFGNGHITKKQGSFIYNYTDKKSSHIVKLKISEGTKIKTITKKVVKNVRNILKARKKGLKVFSYPKINKDNQILVKSQGDKVFIYTGESTGNIKYYSIDYDISYDSDLNGGKDDDADNKKTASYTSGAPVEIKLNKSKIQKLRFVSKDSSGEVIDSYDIEIIKNYITKNSININEITFKGISESEKVKIEKLKSLIANIEQKSRLKSMMYLQKLQDSWFDHTEKTRVILEFEGFIDNAGIDKNNKIIGLLESLLVEGQKDKSEKSISFNALKNLVPSDVNCEFKSDKYKTCREYIIGELLSIKNSSNIIENKTTGSIILKILLSNAKEKGNKWMSSKNLLDFKAIIKTLIYGGVSSIPSVEKDKVVSDNPVPDNTSSGGLLSTVLYSLLIIILIVIGLVFVYWIYFKLNKKPGETFEDFITHKTRDNSIDKDNDILSNLDDLGNVEEVKEEKNSDIFSEEPKEEIKENKEKPIPSPLHSEGTKLAPTKGGYPLKREEIKDNKEEIEENSKEDLDNITKIEEDNIPSWLKASLETSKSNVSEDKKEEPIAFQALPLKREEIEVKKEEIKDNKEEIEENSKEELDNIPDWLKGSIDDGEKKKEEKKEEKKGVTKKEELEVKKEVIEDKKGNKKENKNKEKKEEKKEEKLDKKETVEKKKLFNKESKEKAKEKKEVEVKIEEEVKTEEKKVKEVSNKEELFNKKEEKKGKDKEQIIEKKDINKEKDKKVLKEEKKIKTEKLDESETEESLLDFGEDIKESSDLWDDGMKIPDWLQTGDNEDNKKEAKKENKKENIIKEGDKKDKK